MGNAVAKLKSVERPRNEYVVQELERMLDEARQGHILSMVYAVERHASETHPHGVQTGTFGNDNAFFVLGMATRLLHQVQQTIDEAEEGSA